MVVEALRREGVDTLFGYPGGSVIPLFDALYDASDIRLVLTRHEQAAVHAADGYARATGKVGVCVVTSGPGATNTITGLATARFDSVPVVCIAGQVVRSMIGNDAFQEADTVGITQPVTKHNYLVMAREELGKILRQSFHLASSGRPGPVVVDVPKDVLIELGSDEYPKTVSLRGYRPASKASAEQLTALAASIEAAERPLFFVGGGVVLADAGGDLAQVLEKGDIPFVTSLMGIGAVDSAHPLHLGMIGMHGAVAANKALGSCDLLVGLGVRFDDRAVGDPARFAPHARIAHVDIDPSSIGRNFRVDLPVVGDLRSVLRDLDASLRRKDRSTWRAEVEGFMALGREIEAKSDEAREKRGGEEGALPSPKAVLGVLKEVFGDAVFATEVGQHQMWAAQYLSFAKPRRWLTSGGLGTMGYGFPAAMGAQAGLPGESVVVVAGDGSFQMNIHELATCVQERLPVIVVVMNNGYLGMVRQWQELFFRRRYSHTCLRYGGDCAADCSNPGLRCPPAAPDFAGIARAYGAEGWDVFGLEELREAAEVAKLVRKPTVIDCHIAREENVWPIVPPGAGNDQMLYEGVSI